MGEEKGTSVFEIAFVELNLAVNGRGEAAANIKRIAVSADIRYTSAELMHKCKNRITKFSPCSSARIEAIGCYVASSFYSTLPSQ